MKKMSDVYIEAYKRIHDLDKNLHKKYNQQHLRSLADYFV